MFTNSQVRYLARESFAAFRRMKGMTLISTLIMSVALLMLALFILVTLNLRDTARSLRSEIEVNVFVKNDATVESVQALRERLLEQPGVEAVAYISKDDALAEFRQQLGADSDLVDVLEENPMPASLRIRVQEAHRTSEKLHALATYLRDQPEVDEVRYGDTWVARLEEAIRVFTIVDLMVGAIVLLSAMFVVSNTVRLTVLARQRTIEIMRLVGATNWFIRTPFFVEGAVQGAVAGGLALLVLWGAHGYAAQHVQPLRFYEPLQIVVFVIACALVCSMGSLSALRRFLRL
jgi:cell division transport system permease protein